MLREVKYNEDNDVMFYSSELLIEFTNMIFSNTNLIHKIESFYLNRNTTTPLEHKFGMVRIRCEDVNTLRRFKTSMAELQIYETHINKGKVNGRKQSFGVVVDETSNEFFDEDCSLNINDCSPMDLAKAVLKIATFSIEEEIQLDSLSWFMQLLEYLDPPVEKRSHITSYSLELGIHHGFRENQTIKGQSNFTKYTYQSFKKFVKDFKRNIIEIRAKEI